MENELTNSESKEQEGEQNNILKKRARKCTAKNLPQGLTHDMMKKYVVYYHEYRNPEKTRSREFFKIEKHPKLKKIWIGTKSNKVSLQDKLKQVNKVVEDLEKENDTCIFEEDKIYDL